MLLPITLAPAVDPSPSPPCQSLAAICQRAKSTEQRQIERWEWLSETAPMPLSGCPAFPRRPLYAPLPVSLAASLYASLCMHAFCRTHEPQVPPFQLWLPPCVLAVFTFACSVESVPMTPIRAAQAPASAAHLVTSSTVPLKVEEMAPPGSPRPPSARQGYGRPREVGSARHCAP